MAVFEEVPLEWEGKKYAIKPERMLQAIRLLEYMEPSLTLQDLMRFRGSGRLPLATMAEAYALLLRYAGAEVTKDEVYEGMFLAEPEVIQQRAAAAAEMLLTLMIPPAALAKSGKEEAAGNQTGGSSPNSTSS